MLQLLCFFKQQLQIQTVLPSSQFLFFSRAQILALHKSAVRSLSFIIFLYNLCGYSFLCNNLHRRKKEVNELIIVFIQFRHNGTSIFPFKAVVAGNASYHTVVFLFNKTVILPYQYYFLFAYYLLNQKYSPLTYHLLTKIKIQSS